MVRLERKKRKKERKKRCQLWNHKVASSVFLLANYLAQRHKWEITVLKLNKQKKNKGAMTLNQMHWGKNDGTKIAHVIGDKTCNNLRTEWKFGFLSEK